jgi:hypothetical protein
MRLINILIEIRNLPFFGTIEKICAVSKARSICIAIVVLVFYEYVNAPTAGGGR